MANKRIMRRVTEVYSEHRGLRWLARLTCGHVVMSHRFQHIGALRQCRACEKEEADAPDRQPG